MEKVGERSASAVKDNLCYRGPRVVWAVLLVLFLAACTGSVRNIFSSDNNAPQTPQTAQPAPVRPGGTKVAILLPLSATGKAGEIARALKEAGELALFDNKDPGFVLVSKDTGGTSAGAQKAVSQAINEGAELILGPLFSGSVQAAKPVSQSRAVPMVAFSTDRNVAGNNTYLLSFLPSQDVERIVDYAVKRRIRRFSALIPRSEYGNVVADAFQKAVAARRGTVVALERYTRTPQGVAAPVQKIVQSTKTGRRRAQAIFIPEGGAMLRAISTNLAQAGLNKRIRLLGTGLWDEPNIGTVPGLAGAWFAAPDPAAKQSFVSRYRSTYNRLPPRIASLAYDAVSLAVALSRNTPPGQRYLSTRLTTPDGFAGVDGLFRLMPDGTNQRGLAILEVTTTGARVVDPAASNFAKGSAAF